MTTTTQTSLRQARNFVNIIGYLKKKDLEQMAGVSHYVMNKLTHGDNVTTDILGRICKALDCSLDDIMEFVDE